MRKANPEKNCFLQYDKLYIGEVLICVLRIVCMQYYLILMFWIVCNTTIWMRGRLTKTKLKLKPTKTRRSQDIFRQQNLRLQRGSWSSGGALRKCQVWKFKMLIFIFEIIDKACAGKNSWPYDVFVLIVQKYEKKTSRWE